MLLTHPININKIFKKYLFIYKLIENASIRTHLVRQLSVSRTLNKKPTKPKYDVVKPTVLHSPYYTIFENLALEHWLYKHVNFEGDDGRLLMLWSNRPCVVIGRHQNVFAECNSACLDYGNYESIIRYLIICILYNILK